MLTKRIESIEFGILNPGGIRKMSALEIRSPETYDKDGYPMESGLMDPHMGVINPGLRCKTCGQKMKLCPGHFGHLELVRPVVHSEFGKKIEQLLISSCKACGRIALPEEKLLKLKGMLEEPGVDLTKKIVNATKKVKKCPHCNEAKGEVALDKPTNFYLDKERIYPTEIREWLEKMQDNDLLLFGYDTERIRPEWFVMTVLMVPPITIRPSITLESGIRSEDDLTHKLVDIIRINLRLKDNIEAGAPQLIIEDLWDLLQYHVTTYFDNNTAGVPPAKHRSGRALRTLVQRLKGKKGRFRYNLTGKRVNFASRGIITPDPHISINELGVPEFVTEELTVPEFVTQWNLKEMKDILKKQTGISYVVTPNNMRKRVTDENRELIVEELDVGYKIERRIKDGDIVLFNRQPSLHRLSMLAHRIKVMPGKTFRLNPTVCKPYNADFDGDEMNMHIPQTEEGKTEAKELMYVQEQIISPRYGAPVIVLDEDAVSGAFILSLDSTEFSREDAMRYFHIIGKTTLPAPDRPNGKYSGKVIFSALLPEDFNIEYETKTSRITQQIAKEHPELEKRCQPYARVVIENGQLKRGAIDGTSLGEGKGLLIDALAREYGPDVVANFYDKINKIVEDVVTRFGMSVGLDEFFSNSELEKVKKSAIDEELEAGALLEKEFKAGTTDIIPGRTLNESFELHMMRLGAQTKDKVEQEIMRQKVGQVFSNAPEYNSIVMIMSGSRGSAINLTNIMGLWGQASVREGRPRRGFRDRLITTNKKKDVGALAGGYIRHNFMEGMGPKEYFYHSMGGRQGEVDTGVSTKVSGYLYRRLANSLKDLMVHNDETVRTASRNLIQYHYGEDSVFPANSFLGKSVNTDIALRKLRSAQSTGKKG